MEVGPNKIILMVVICATLLLQFGLIFSFGATFIHLLEKYGRDRSRTSIVHSLFLGIGLIFGALSGALVDKIGLLNMSILASLLGPCGFISSFFSTSLEFLYCSIGIVGGTGVALVNICCSTAIVRVFTGKQRSLCLSIAYSAPALSSVVYPNLITVFLNEYGLNGTWLLIGGLFLHSWPLPVLIYFYRPLMEYHVHRPTELEKETSPIAKGTLVPGKEGFVNLALQTDSDDPSLKTIDTVSNDTQITRQIGTVSLTVDGKPNGAAFLKTEDGIVVKANARENDTEEEIDNRQNGCFGKFKAVLVNKPYIFLIIGSSFIMGTCNAYVALVFDIADWKEFTRSQVLVLFIPYSACCTLSRIAPGALEQFKGVNTYVFPIVIITLAVGAQMVILYTTLYALFVVGVCLIGLASGGTLSSVIVLSMNIVKPEQQAIASGMLFTLMGVFSTVCTPIFGKVRDKTGSYDLVSYLAAILFSIGLTGIIISLILSRRARKHRTPGDYYTMEIVSDK